MPLKPAITKLETSLADAEMRLHLAVEELTEARNERDHLMHLWQQEQTKPKRKHDNSTRIHATARID